MGDEEHLIVVLVHGIGDQNESMQNQFLRDVERIAENRLDRRGLARLADQAHYVRVEWEEVGKDEGTAWKKTQFPETVGHSAHTMRLLHIVIVTMILLLVFGAVFCLFSPTVSAKTCCDFCLQLIQNLPAVLYAALVALVVATVVFLLLSLLRVIDWGRVYFFLRGFEAHTLSDILIYQSSKGRQLVFQAVIKTVEDSLKDIPASDAKAKIVLLGHSLGSVIIYDMLLGICNPNNAIERELRLLEAAASTDGKIPTPKPNSSLKPRIDFLKDLQNLYARVEPIGVATFGSPIPFFLFRKPDLILKHRAEQQRVAGSPDAALWKAVCPQQFHADGKASGITWRWQNFCHACDFVAHRMENLFRHQFTSGHRFVEDVNTSATKWVWGPLKAHASYWTTSVVKRRIANQIVDSLLQMAAANQRS